VKEKQRRVGILEMQMSKTAGLTYKKSLLIIFLATSLGTLRGGVGVCMSLKF